MCVYIYIYMCVYIYICVYICVYIYIYVTLFVEFNDSILNLPCEYLSPNWIQMDTM